MALSGMTGFARVDGAHNGASWTWEARSVNGKGLDIRLRLPTGHERLEARARELVQKRFARGSVTLGLQLRRQNEDGGVSLDRRQAAAYAAASQRLVRRGMATPLAAGAMLGLRGVMTSDASLEDDAARSALDEAVLASLAEGVEALHEARLGEGAALSPVLERAVDRIDALRADAENAAGAQPAAIRDRLAGKLAELVDGGVDPERLAVEVAVLATKADVREELDRLAAHVEQARTLLAGDAPAGRKLDFLTQEFMREANTTCSKSADIELTRIGLELKAAIEQFREQVQNVQ